MSIVNLICERFIRIATCDLEYSTDVCFPFRIDFLSFLIRQNSTTKVPTPPPEDLDGDASIYGSSSVRNASDQATKKSKTSSSTSQPKKKNYGFAGKREYRILDP